MVRTAGYRLGELTKKLMQEKKIPFGEAFRIVQKENNALAEIYTFELQNLGNFSEIKAQDWQVYFTFVSKKIDDLVKARADFDNVNFGEATSLVMKDAELNGLYNDILRGWNASNKKNAF